ASRSASRRARRDVNCSSAILTPVQHVLRDVLHDSVRHEVPDGRTIHHPLSAIRRRYRQWRKLHETQPGDRQPINMEYVPRAAAEEVRVEKYDIDILPRQALNESVRAGQEELLWVPTLATSQIEQLIDGVPRPWPVEIDG